MRRLLLVLLVLAASCTKESTTVLDFFEPCPGLDSIPAPECRPDSLP